MDETFNPFASFFVTPYNGPDFAQLEQNISGITEQLPPLPSLESLSTGFADAAGFGDVSGWNLDPASIQLPEVSVTPTPEQPQMAQLGPFVVPKPTVETSTLPPPAAGAFTANGLNIQYAVDPNAPYGKSATMNAQPFQGIVFHYTGGSDLNTDVAYGQRVDPARGGSFGYHFYIGPNGEIVQGAPLDARTNHIKDPAHPARIGGLELNNSNAIGISLVGNKEEPTQAQLDSARQLATALRDTYGIKSFYGHGEVQRDRQSAEGTTLARLMRGDQPLATVAAPAPSRVHDAIRSAANETGMPYNLLLGVAQTESSLNPKADNGYARGLFQITDKTWSYLVGKYGALYGVQNANQFDSRAAGLMAGQYLKDIRTQYEANLPGRPLTNTDLYMGYFLGPNGGERFLKGLSENPTGLAKDYAAQDQVSRNYSVFFAKDGTPRTLQEVYGNFDKKLTANLSPQNDTAARTDPRTPINPQEVWAPPPLPLDKKYNDAQREVQRMQTREQSIGFWQGTWESLKQEGLTTRLLQGGRRWTPDPSYAGSDAAKQDFQQLSAGLPEDMLSRFAVAVSRDHMVDIATRAHAEHQLSQALGDAGWVGPAARLTAAFADPASLVIGAATGGAGTALATALRAGQVGSRLIGGVSGAVGNLLVDAGSRSLVGEDMPLSEAALSAIAGATLGAAFGPIGRNIATQREAAELMAATRSSMVPDVEVRAPAQDVEIPVGPTMSAADNAQRADNLRSRYGIVEQPEQPATPTAQSAGAAVNPHATPEALSDPVLRGVQQDSVPTRAGGVVVEKLGFSEGGKAAVAQNPLTRMLGGILGLDNIGKEGLAVNPISADQEMMQYLRTNQYQWRSHALPAYQEWATEQGYNFISRGIGRGWDEFNQLVTAYVREADATIAAQAHQSVQRAGEQFRRLMKQMAEDQRNPWLRKNGNTGGSVAGAENLVPDPHYVMRVWSVTGINRAVEHFGHNSVVRLLAASIKNVRPAIDDDLAEKFANSILRSRYTRAYGYDDRLESVFGNHDIHIVREMMRNEYGWSEPDIDRLISQLRKSEPNVAPRFKHRIPVDENFFLDDISGYGTGRLAVSDLLENNADTLMGYYMRKASGDIALARQRFVNPLNGDVVVDGIKSDADFEKVIRAIQQWHQQNGTDLGAVHKEVDGLRWMYDRIKGRPDPAQLYDWADWLRVAKNYNFARLMGQLGFAQMMDTGRIVGTLGVKSFMQHMRGFRRIQSMDGQTILKHGLDHELEAAFGMGTDPLRGFTALVMEDAGHVKSVDRGRVVDRLQNVTEVMADATAVLSGTHYVNAWLQLVTGRMIAQKFANMATGRLSKSDMRYIRFLGLDDDMLNRVLAQVNQHFTHETGALFGRKVARMNLDNWTDTEARAAFESALFRWSRHIVQENDVGAMHRMMSHPLAQTMTQFRSYAMTAWENQLLHGIAHHDGRAFAQFAASMFSGALVYAVQTQLQALGRSDADEFLEKRMAPGAFGAAVFQRAGFSSLIPMMVDTAAVFTPAGPVFDARPSGQATDFIFGNPFFSLIDDTRKTTSALLGAAIKGRELSQQDLRQMARIGFWQNVMPFAQIFSTLISDQPLKAR